MTIKPTPNEEPISSSLKHTFSEYGAQTITHTITRVFKTDRKLQRAIDEARVLYNKHVPPRVNIMETVELGRHLFMWHFDAHDSMQVFRREYIMESSETLEVLCACGCGMPPRP
jgi:hypothetical protein